MTKIDSFFLESEYRFVAKEIALWSGATSYGAFPMREKPWPQPLIAGWTVPF
jgi:hypothetical protein